MSTVTLISPNSSSCRQALVYFLFLQNVLQGTHNLEIIADRVLLKACKQKIRTVSLLLINLCSDCVRDLSGLETKNLIKTSLK